jgi:hypothetical protein
LLLSFGLLLVISDKVIADASGVSVEDDDGIAIALGGVVGVFSAIS